MAGVYGATAAPRASRRSRAALIVAILDYAQAEGIESLEVYGRERVSAAW